MTEQFHRPSTPTEAVELAAKSEGRAVFLAGGTSFESADYHRGLEILIDVTALNLQSIEASAEGLVLGAGCTLQQILESDAVYEPIRAAIRQIGNRNVRNLATIGGQLGANEFVGDVLPVLVAMHARVDLVTDGGPKTVSVQDYLAAPNSGLITQIVVPQPTSGRVTAVQAFALTAIDRSIITVAASLARDGDLVREPIVVVGGVAERVVRLPAVETAIEGKALAGREQLEELIREHVSPKGDVRGSASYRRHLAGVLTESAIRAAYGEVAS